MMAVLSAPARAEGPEDPLRPVVTWTDTDQGRVLQVRGLPGQQVEVRFRAMLAELEHTWQQGPQPPGCTPPPRTTSPTSPRC